MDSNELETFYVYKSLHSDESWGTVMGECPANRLPNICFGMKVYAKNEKHAIARARDKYEQLHACDSDKNNIKRFACAGFGENIRSADGDISSLGLKSETAALRTLAYARKLNDKYKELCKELDREVNDE